MVEHHGAFYDFGPLPSADLYREWADRGVRGTLAAPWWLATPDEKAACADPLALKIATMERFAEEVITKM